MSSLGVVVLSQGDRPTELARALRSVTGTPGVDTQVVVVGNGWVPEDLPPGVASVALVDNVGVPEGRNVGAAAVVGDVLLFLDDDAVLHPGVTAQALRQFDDDPCLGVLQPRAVDPDGLPTARRHVPRLRAGDPTRAGDVAWFWEGCSFIRRAALETAGGWPGEFFYGHEGIEVAWRVVDAGYRIRYAAELAVDNPEAPPFRGERHRFMDARNRVWVARRNLPVPLAAVYLLVWATATLLRARDRSDRSAALSGFVAGAREPCGPRRPVSWRTAWRLTRLGRPPVV